LAEEPLHNAALALITELADKQMQIIVPPLFLCERDSTIRLRVYKGDYNDEEASQARNLIAALGVVIDTDVGIHDRAFEIARVYNQPRCYDATYAALAEARNLNLWTADERFYNSVAGTNIKNPLRYVKFLGSI
jgi:predicted nucleic acid-binding protein